MNDAINFYYEICQLFLLFLQAFWRSSSFITGYILERAFKDEHYIELCSFPKPSGSECSNLNI